VTESKYGEIVASRKELPPDEPLFLLRGQDLIAPSAIDSYASHVRAVVTGVTDASRAQRLTAVADECESVAAAMRVWQADNPDRTKYPD